MPTAYISHPDCLLHETGLGHPECTQRLEAIEDRLLATQLYGLMSHFDAPDVATLQLLRVHDERYIEEVEKIIPEEGLRHLDPDTAIGPHSLQAAKKSAGALVLATELVLDGRVSEAFCAVRPPGHHAERDRGMGFCIFNNVAVGAAHALEQYGLERVAILDFDVHHGNGTENIFRNDDRVMFCSTFQYPFYPNFPYLEGHHNIINAPLQAGSKGAEFREAVASIWLPALHRFEPEMFFISAGFDAHIADDMSGIGLVEDDFIWVTEQIVTLANQYAGGKIVSTLEGGYELHSLARSVESHLRVLMGLSA